MKKTHSVKFLFGHLAVSYVRDDSSAETYGLKVDSPDLARDAWFNTIAKQDTFRPQQEQLALLLLNTRHKLIGVHIVSIGSINESIADPRDVLRPVILSNSHAAILMHNHPSGESAPSEMDRRMTQRMKDCFNLLRCNLLDHIIVGNSTHDRYFSFKEAGLL
jgi:DNA repair protein RadC